MAQPLLFSDAVLILDGGMGRELQAMGAPFRQPEWSALALMEARASAGGILRRLPAHRGLSRLAGAGEGGVRARGVRAGWR